MKRIAAYLLCATLTAAFLVPGQSIAQDDMSAQQVTQAELAQALVNLMGLSRFVSHPTTPQELFAVLMANGVSPAGGWSSDAVVTKADLARVLVQAMDSADQIENQDDPDAYIAWLMENGIPIDTVGEAASNIVPVVDPVGNLVFNAGLTSDPLDRQAVFGQPDERQYGIDVNANANTPIVTVEPVPPPSPPIRPPDLDDLLPIIPVPPPPTTPVTPDGGR